MIQIILIEIEQIDKTIEYIDNNVSASRHAIWTFVYWYYMHLKKVEIQNLSIKITNIQKRIDETNIKIDSLKNLEKERRAMIKKSTWSPYERLQKEKQLLVEINIIVSNVNSFNTALQKDTKLLEEYNLALIELQKTFKEFASIAKEDLDLYCEFSFNWLGLKEWLSNSNYPIPKKLPIDISDFASIEKLINFLKENWLQSAYSMEDIKKIYKSI